MRGDGSLQRNTLKIDVGVTDPTQEKLQRPVSGDGFGHKKAPKVNVGAAGLAMGKP